MSDEKKMDSLDGMRAIWRIRSGFMREKGRGIEGAARPDRAGYSNAGKNSGTGRII